MKLHLLAIAALALSFAGCRTTCADPQNVVETIAAANPDCTRLTLHCKGEDGTLKVCAIQPGDRNREEAIAQAKVIAAAVEAELGACCSSGSSCEGESCCESGGSSEGKSCCEAGGSNQD